MKLKIIFKNDTKNATKAKLRRHRRPTVKPGWDESNRLVSSALIILEFRLFQRRLNASSSSKTKFFSILGFCLSADALSEFFLSTFLMI